MHEGEPGTSERAAPVDPVTALEARLGLTLADRALALAALTHRSYVNEHREDGLQDNERLEFLGDAVIDLAVSHRLMERFPAAREGDLSKMRAAVVDEQGLADMARALDLGSLLRLGRGEELTGGRAKASLLADAMEAVIAAVYHVQGLEGVLAVIDRFLGEAFARAAAGTLDRDFKTQLQELAQSTLRVTPRYRVVAEHGPDHSKIFEVEVDLRGEVLGRGRGRSKKDSEQGAARLALDALGRRLAAVAVGADAGSGAGAGADSGTAEGGGAMACAPEAQVGPAERAVASAPELRPGPAAPMSAPASESPGGGAPVEAETPPAATQAAGPAVAARNGEDRVGGAEARPLPVEAGPRHGPGKASSPAARSGKMRPGEAPAAAAPSPRKRTASPKRAAPAKRPPRRSAATATARAGTGAKRASGSAARGAARPARKGSRARR